MRIVCLCNNWLGWQVLRWLKDQGEEIVALIAHPSERSKYGEEIQSVVAGTKCLTFSGPHLSDRGVLQAIRDLGPETAISVLFGYILRPDFLKLFPAGCFNLHTALLPYNRGAYPNVWSIVEKTPSGVTLHYVDEGVDTGDIVAQREVLVSPVDTGASLYRKLETEALALFRDTWPAVRMGQSRRRTQNAEAATFHKVRDVQRIDEIELGKQYESEHLIDIIRARTFPPYPGAFIRKDGKKIYLRLELLDEADLGEDRGTSE